MVDDSKYGPTFEAEQAVRVIPIPSGAFRSTWSITSRASARRRPLALMSKFGVAIDQTSLTNSPERLTECTGIGADKADKIVAAWRSHMTLCPPTGIVAGPLLTS